MKLTLAWLKYLAFQAISKPILAVVYYSVISEGLRILIPPLAQRIHRLPLPFVGDLQYSPIGRRLDLAHGFALLLLAAGYSMTTKYLESKLGDPSFDIRTWTGRDFHEKFAAFMTLAVLGSDTTIFYVSLAQWNWAGGGLSFTALVAALAYAAVLVFCAYVAVTLRMRIRELKDKSGF